MTATARAGLPRPRARAGYAAPLLPPAWARLVGFAPLVGLLRVMWARDARAGSPHRDARGGGRRDRRVRRAARRPRQVALRGARRGAVAGRCSRQVSRRGCCSPGSGTSWPRAWAAPSATCRRRTCRTAGSDAWIDHRAAAHRRAARGPRRVARVRAAPLGRPARPAARRGRARRPVHRPGRAGRGWAPLAAGDRARGPAVRVPAARARRAPRRGARRWRSSWSPGSPPSSRRRGSTSAGRCSTRRRWPTRWPPTAACSSRGTTTTARCAGRAPAARCCASARGRRATGRSRTSRASTGCAGWRPASSARPSRRRACVASQRDWRSEIHVRVRAFISRLFVGAGTTLAISSSPRTPIRNAPGHVPHRPAAAARGPEPTTPPCGTRGRRSASCAARRASCPRGRGRTCAWTSRARRAARCCARRAAASCGRRRRRRSRSPATRSTARRSSTRGGPGRRRWRSTTSCAAPPTAACTASRSSCGRGRRRRTSTCGASSTTSPTAATGTRRSRRPAPCPLASFLLGDKQGYCQQFSGAMALLLRMEGVPARVATGFSPGTTDRDTDEFVVRDTDAHSWVEAYIAPYGWVTFDPTPPVGPARLNAGVGLRRQRLPLAAPAGRARRRRARRRPRPGRREGGRRLAAAVDLAGVARARGLAVTAALLWRRRRRGDRRRRRRARRAARRAGGDRPHGAPAG